MKKTKLEEEVLVTLRNSYEPMTAYKICRYIEAKWLLEGYKFRFLFWKFDWVIGYGTIHRVLDHLTESGKITRTLEVNPVRVTWKIKEW